MFVLLTKVFKLYVDMYYKIKNYYGHGRSPCEHRLAGMHSGSVENHWSTDNKP